jgi:4-amino-4-deoxy-L-arabinose transferase-like glycosyltransferase
MTLRAFLPVFLIFFIGFVLRIVGLSSLPSGFTPDEASFGYDAYSILHTGRDQWGKLLPLTLESFGDNKLPLYSYLTIPSIALFGLTEFAVRLPNAVLGSIAILATYVFVYQFFAPRELPEPEEELEPLLVPIIFILNF